ncbi:unnamed protein product [Prorocentrum cordatum]|uniref:Uncharacterized protein n=1 Tax=Prorocentrum cordatum TaxID=2364126 RepID=A0ABN9UUG5_9DINO|nr:unnamed protein product [Polarella glacialis]
MPSFYGRSSCKKAQEALEGCNGVDFYGYTSWPNTTGEQDGIGVIEDASGETPALNVMYSSVPVAFTVASIMYVFAMLATSDSTVTEQFKNKLSTLQLHSKYFTLSIVVLMVAHLEKMFIKIPRPGTSCMHTCGTPDGMDVWAMALFVIRMVDLMFRWALPFMSFKHDDGDLSLEAPLLQSTKTKSKPIYTEAEAARLGYYPITAGQLLLKGGATLALLIPVPFSRVVLGDETFLQMLLGVAQGLVIALLWHVCYVSMLTSPACGPFVYRSFATSMVFCGMVREQVMRDGFVNISSACSEAYNKAGLIVREDLMKTGDYEIANRLKPASGCSIRNARGFEFLAIETYRDLKDIREDVAELKGLQKSLQDTVKQLDEQQKRLEYQVKGLHPGLRSICERDLTVDLSKHDGCEQSVQVPCNIPGMATLSMGLAVKGEPTDAIKERPRHSRAPPGARSSGTQPRST